MTNKLEIYHCKICGNIVQVLIEGVGEIYCCGEAMELMEIKTQEGNGGEFHVPVFKHCEEKGDFVQVGKEPHPMTEEHHIELIETISEDKKCINLHYLNIPDEPKMYYENKHKKMNCALEICNLHGLWGGKNNEQ